MTRCTRFEPEVKAELLKTVARAREATGWTLRRILSHLGLSKARYREWTKRRDQDRLRDLPTRSPLLDGILEEEKVAVCDYALKHPKDGYRRLAWQMVDEDVAYLSPSSVYRILSEADLLSRWKRSSRIGNAPPKPERPHERWHTDIMYLRVVDNWYFLVTVLDAYSRYVVHWELLTSMRASEVELVIQQALEVTGANPDLVTDSGPQFTSLEFKGLVRRFQLEHIRIRTYHPESNGLIERFHRSTREELESADLENLAKAREIIARWVKHYNEERLHAGLNYLTPAEYYRGEPESRLAEREAKLERAREERRRRNQLRQQAAA
jgi:transposase InsO family protein